MKIDLNSYQYRNHKISLSNEGKSFRINGQNKEVALLIPDENRIEWKSSMELQGLDYEVKKFDEWANTEDIKSSRGAKKIDTVDEWLKHSLPHHDISTILKAIGSFKGKRIVDIGGSCKDSWRFILWGAEHVDQVEVSPESQRVGYIRCKKHLSGQVKNWEDKITFHTVPAENLPFEDNFCDLVFSRATIHHTKRELVFPEIHRILKPKGKVFFIERRASWFVYQLIMLMRKVQKVNRGTDDPLTKKDFSIAKKYFTNVFHNNCTYMVLKQIPFVRNITHLLNSLETKRGIRIPLLHPLLSVQAWYVGTKR